ncbi:MAG: deoxynucleoside kinase, partial [Chloroflexi bacterium]|nr:deoxynucleoside kinase [Chloroflexota bacterium]
HRLLAEKIPSPHLVVYLRADTDVLMERIAHRDRPYERAMSRPYIAELAQAYERFFADYTEAPVLTIDTARLDIIRRPEDLQGVLGRIRAALEEGVFQAPLPSMEGLVAPSAPEEPATRLGVSRRLTDFQALRRAAQGQLGLSSDPYFGFIGFTTLVGELGTLLQAAWSEEDARTDAVGNRPEARARALETRQVHLQETMAACLDALVCLANLSQVDLESTYLKRLAASGGGSEGR